MKIGNSLFENLEAGKWLCTAAGDFPRWKKRGLDWSAGASDWGAMAAGIRRFKVDCDKMKVGA